MSSSLSPRRSLFKLVAAVALALLLAAPASASSETIKRAVTNLIFGPFDFALSPIVGARTVYNNLRDVDDTTGVRVAYAIPGVVWNTAFIAGGGVLRCFSGLIEFVPGLILIPFEADMDPIYAPVERSDALFDEEFEFITIKVGVNYVQ